MTVYDPANMAEGIFKAYVGNPAGSATPATMPLDSAPYNTPGSAFQALGATQGGVTPAGINPPETPVYADHQRGAFGRFAGDVETTFTFNMIETDPGTQYKVSSIGSQSAVAAGTSTKGSTSFKLTSQRRPDVSLLFEGVGGNNEPWRIFIPRARLMISAMGPVVKGAPRTMTVVATAIPAQDSEAVEFRQVNPATGA